VACSPRGERRPPGGTRAWATVGGLRRRSRGGERNRDRDRDRDGETETEIDSGTETETDREAERQRQRGREKERGEVAPRSAALPCDRDTPLGACVGLRAPGLGESGGTASPFARFPFRVQGPGSRVQGPGSRVAPGAGRQRGGWRHRSRRFIEKGFRFKNLNAMKFDTHHEYSSVRVVNFIASKFKIEIFFI